MAVVAEALGKASVVVEGLFGDPDISAVALIRRRLPALPVEPVVLDLLLRAKLARSSRIVNGLVPGNLTRGWPATPWGR